MDGDAELQGMISRLRGMRTFAAEVATEAAPLVEAAARRSVIANTTPQGKPWAPNKKEGGRVLENAAAHITAVAMGTAIELTLEGHDVFHHFGTARVPERQVLPKPGDPLPPGYVEAMAEATSRVLFRRLG